MWNLRRLLKLLLRHPSPRTSLRVPLFYPSRPSRYLAILCISASACESYAFGGSVPACAFSLGWCAWHLDMSPCPDPLPGPGRLQHRGAEGADCLRRRALLGCYCRCAAAAVRGGEYVSRERAAGAVGAARTKQKKAAGASASPFSLGALGGERAAIRPSVACSLSLGSRLIHGRWAGPSLSRP